MMKDANMVAILAKWGFKPVDSNGQPLVQPQEVKQDSSIREMAKQLLGHNDESANSAEEK
jgi:hypothetical protein